MGRHSTIRSLSPEMLMRAEALIREFDYIHLEQVLHIMRAEGINTSRSALNRYAMKLKQQDGLFAGSPDRTVVVLLDRITGNVTTLSTSATSEVVTQTISNLTTLGKP